MSWFFVALQKFILQKIVLSNSEHLSLSRKNCFPAKTLLALLFLQRSCFTVLCCLHIKCEYCNLFILQIQDETGIKDGTLAIRYFKNTLLKQLLQTFRGRYSSVMKDISLSFYEKWFIMLSTSTFLHLCPLIKVQCTQSQA